MFWIPLLLTVVVQIVSVAYFSGKYSSLVNEHQRRMNTLEERANFLSTQVSELNRMVEQLNDKLYWLRPGMRPKDAER